MDLTSLPQWKQWKSDRKPWRYPYHWETIGSGFEGPVEIGVPNVFDWLLAQQLPRTAILFVSPDLASDTFRYASQREAQPGNGYCLVSSGPQLHTVEGVLDGFLPRQMTCLFGQLLDSWFFSVDRVLFTSPTILHIWAPSEHHFASMRQNSWTWRFATHGGHENGETRRSSSCWAARHHFIGGIKIKRCRLLRAIGLSVLPGGENTMLGSESTLILKPFIPKLMTVMTSYLQRWKRTALWAILGCQKEVLCKSSTQDIPNKSLPTNQGRGRSGRTWFHLSLAWPLVFWN